LERHGREDERLSGEQGEGEVKRGQGGKNGKLAGGRSRAK